MKSLFRHQTLSITLERQQSHDRLFANFTKQVLRMSTNFPSELIYMAKSDAGFGLPRISDHTNIRKLSTLVRCLQSSSGPRNAALCLINRLLREYTVPHPVLAYQFPLAHNHTQDARVNFLHSTLQWLQLNNLTLHRGGATYPYGFNTPICHLTQLTSTETTALHKIGLHTMGDLTYRTITGITRWISPYTLHHQLHLSLLFTAKLTKLCNRHSIPEDSPWIWRHHMWHVGLQSKILFEILSINPDATVTVRRWISNSSTISKGNTVKLLDLSIGAGTSFTTELKHLFPPAQQIQRITCTDDIVTPTGLHRRILFLHDNSSIPVNPPPPPSLLNPLRTFLLSFPWTGPIAICTDGSFTRDIDLRSTITYAPSTGKSGAAIVIIEDKDTWRSGPIAIITFLSKLVEFFD